VRSLRASIDEFHEQNKTLPPSRGQKADLADASTTKKGREGHPGITASDVPFPMMSTSSAAPASETTRHRFGRFV
jgi:hypothetical protein